MEFSDPELRFELSSAECGESVQRSRIAQAKALVTGCTDADLSTLGALTWIPTATIPTGTIAVILVPGVHDRDGGGVSGSLGERCGVVPEGADQGPDVLAFFRAAGRR